MILDDILRDKKIEVARLKAKKSLVALKEQAGKLSVKKNRFLASLRAKKGMAVIAEIKRRSPSKGLLKKDFNAVNIAREYARAGAGALSVLTDEKYFGGSAAILQKVRRAVRLPILRKDFTIDEYQIYESRLLNADAILLIVRVLTRGQLKRFYALAKKLGLETLFEVHNEADLKKIRPLKPRLVGINNRDLRNFSVDLDVTRRLAGKIPAGCFLVSESGIKTPEDLVRLGKMKVRAVLVGETFMKEKHPGLALKRLLGNNRASR